MGKGGVVGWTADVESLDHGLFDGHLDVLLMSEFEFRASSVGMAEFKASGGGRAKARASGGGPTKARASGGGPAKARASGGGPVKARASGGGPVKARASGGGPVKARASDGGLVKMRASGGVLLTLDLDPFGFGLGWIWCRWVHILETLSSTIRKNGYLRGDLALVVVAVAARTENGEEGVRLGLEEGDFRI
ncbi:hypothetical protein MA16_Dca010902 [Dendrobium catenatum]|uniref:Uncharacterized protein n=1 Tax=Dendrobium catenatum TaxID=906689 RepID=A0A2I0X7A6_9ASPA|nr:hypothetical protein MA16_Dca010902 [Dendrobium catenatum]